ncbi:hypothetical protein M405DRAFT_220784 [Rhizopogon salebrosus TDB-379]|nr:hypothetical protein M405DRAFT_220784 [Rhizopogon salebrosus TDB-379]
MSSRSSGSCSSPSSLSPLPVSSSSTSPSTSSDSADAVHIHINVVIGLVPSLFMGEAGMYNMPVSSLSFVNDTESSASRSAEKVCVASRVDLWPTLPLRKRINMPQSTKLQYAYAQLYDEFDHGMVHPAPNIVILAPHILLHPPATFTLVVRTSTTVSFTNPLPWYFSD